MYQTKKATLMKKSRSQWLGPVALATLLIGSLYPPGASAEPLRLVETAPHVRKWMTSEQRLILSHQQHERGKCGGFLDVTDHQDLEPLFLTPLFLFNDLEPTQQSIVRPLLPNVSPSQLMSDVEHLSSYKNRHFRSKSGVAAAIWIRDQFQRMASARPDIEVELVEHNFPQPSVVARIRGQGPLANEVVIIGAHEDSVNWSMLYPFSHLEAPGSDDDASGVASVLEAFRVIVDSGLRPQRTLEFITYAGEELGLLGSQDIAKRYQKERKTVVGVMQLDMTMYPGSSPQITLMTDDVNPELTTFTAKLIDTYLDIPRAESRCGYGCSDHASWTKAGFPAVFPFESSFNTSNPHIHTKKDTPEHLDIAFGTHFVKLAIAFLIELSVAK